MGFQLADSETETSWDELFAYLKVWGIKDVHLISSDQYKGLVNVIRKYFQRITWRRCWTHLSKILLDRTPKYLQSMLKEDLRQLYEAIALGSARKIRDVIIEKYGQKVPKVTLIPSYG